MRRRKQNLPDLVKIAGPIMLSSESNHSRRGLNDRARSDQDLAENASRFERFARVVKFH